MACLFLFPFPKYLRGKQALIQGVDAWALKRIPACDGRWEVGSGVGGALQMELV